MKVDDLKETSVVNDINVVRIEDLQNSVFPLHCATCQPVFTRLPPGSS